MAAIQQRQSQLGDIQSLLDIFKGKSATTTTSEQVSPETANALVQQILQGQGGIAAINAGGKSAGIYNSTTQSLLTNDLVARTAAEVAARSATKTTTQRQNPQLNPLATLGGFAAQTALKTGAKKLGIKTPQQYLEQGYDTLSQSLFPSSVVGVDSIGANAGLSGFFDAPVATGALQDLSFLDSLNEDTLFGAGKSDSGVGELDSEGNVIGGSEGGLGAAGVAGGAALGAGLAAGAGSGAAAGGAAAGGYAIAAGDTAFAAGAAGAAEAGAGLGLGEALAAIVAWIVCTELYRQGRMPYRHYVYGSREFARYDERGKQGYYLWAIPAVKHLRARPNSILSKFLCAVFNSRAQYLAAKAGCRGAKKTVTGWALAHGLYAVCWVLSRTIARKSIDWTQVYSKENYNG